MDITPAKTTQKPHMILIYEPSLSLIHYWSVKKYICIKLPLMYPGQVFCAVPVMNACNQINRLTPTPEKLPNQQGIVVSIVIYSRMDLRSRT